MNPLHKHIPAGLGAQDIIDLWDQGSRFGPGARALYIIAAAIPGISQQNLAQIKVSERDALILAVRARTLGEFMSAITPCPGCGETAEIMFTAEQIGLRPAADLVPVVTETVECGGHMVELRPVTAGDLASLDEITSVTVGAGLLLERVVISIDGESGVMINRELIDPIETAIEELDPLASLDLGITCPECQYAWSIAFDAGKYFWEEIQALVQNLLRDVAELARHFHWSESDILAMPVLRRRMYLEMI